MRLVLASASPRRAELLRNAGFVFEVLVADVDERVRPGELPRDYVTRLAMEKSAAVLALLERQAGSGHRRPDPQADSVGRADRTGWGGGDVLTIGADTAVIVDDQILGKPVDDIDAARMLRLLSGRGHTVITGVSVRSTTRQLDAVEETRVQFTALTEGEIDWYVASGEGRDKAGAYAIQGLASRFIPRIEGSYSNVVGLPMARIAQLIDGRS